MRAALPALLLLAAAVPAFAGDPAWSAAQAVLAERCVECHGPDKAKGGLRLDSEAAVRQGSRDGAVVTPGRPEASTLMRRVNLPEGDEDRMPPRGPRLDEGERRALARWIAAGAGG